MKKILRNIQVFGLLIVVASLLQNSASAKDKDKAKDDKDSHSLEQVTGDCFVVTNSQTERVFFGNEQYGWIADIQNVCAEPKDIEVEIEWFDSNGFSLGSDRDTGLTAAPGAEVRARSTSSLGADIFAGDLVSSHQITVSGVTPLPESVANCLAISSVRSDSMVIDMISQYSWTVTIDNNCSVDLFSSVNYRGISTGGYPVFGPATSNADGPSPSLADIFVPANGSTVARNQFRFRQNAAGPLVADEFRLAENSYPEYSNVRSLISGPQSAGPAFIYNVDTGLTTLNIYEPAMGYFEVTFQIVNISQKVYFIVLPESIRQLQSPPDILATLTSQNGKLFLPALQANDGSVNLTDVTLKFDKATPMLLRLQTATFNEPQPQQSGYSLDGNQCIEIISVNLERGRAGGPDSGPPGLDWSAQISNQCATDQQLAVSYAALNQDGLIAVTQIDSIVLAASTDAEVSGFVIFPRGLQIGQDEMLTDLITVKF